MRKATVIALLSVGLGVGLEACGSEPAETGTRSSEGLDTGGAAPALSGGTTSGGVVGTGGGAGSGGDTDLGYGTSSGGAGRTGAAGGSGGGTGISVVGGSANSGGVPGSGGRSDGGIETGGSGVSTGGVSSSGGAPGSGGASDCADGTDCGGERGGRSATGGSASSGGATGGGGPIGGGGATGGGGAAGSGGGATDGGTSASGASAGSGAGAGGGATNGGTAGTGASDVQSCPESLSPLTAGDHTSTLTHGGRSRSYILHVPDGVRGTEPVALVFDLHGAGGNGRQQQGMSGWQAVADREGFLVVYPDGVDGYWNVDDTCCGTAGNEQIDDVGLIRAIIDELSADSCVDTTRIYVSGFSNGGGLAHRMGCDAGDIVAAVAPVDTDLRTQPCNATRPISMLEVRGLADSLEPYEGGVVGPVGGQYTSPGAVGSLELWADINQCTGTPTPIEEYCEGYSECGDGVETDLCSLPGVGHGSYNNSLNFRVAEVAWRMFERQPMRQ